MRTSQTEPLEPDPPAPVGPAVPTPPVPVAPGAPGEAVAPGAPVAPVIVPRWIQLVLLPLALLGLWALARASGPILLILVAAAVIALILNPLVRLYGRVLPRGLAIFGVYLTGLAILAGIGILLSNPVSTQVNRFAADVPHLVRQANHQLDSFQHWLDRNGIKLQIKQQGQTALQTIQKKVLKSSGSIVSFSRDLLSQIVTVGFDIVLTLVLSVYLLVYGPQIGRLVRRVMPPGDGTPEDDFPLLVQRAVSGYVRGQLLFSVIMGASAALLLWLFGLLGVFPDGAHYALFFGAFYGLMEFVPYIGPIIGPIPALAVALFTDPISALWVLLMFIGLQQLEGHIVAPQVFRLSLRINPILVILSLLIGYQLYGVAGALVALPLAAVIRQTVLYLRRHVVLEPWTALPEVGAGAAGAPRAGAARAGAAGAARAGAAGGPGSVGAAGCPECGAPHSSGDAFCRACGAPLAQDELTPA
jgi:predicted PurR-regulated permease PerM